MHFNRKHHIIFREEFAAWDGQHVTDQGLHTQCNMQYANHSLHLNVHVEQSLEQVTSAAVLCIVVWNVQGCHSYFYV